MKVAVCYGSPNDEKKMQAAIDVLKKWGVEYEVLVKSAHRNPEEVRDFALSAKSRGIKVILAGAGMSNALAGTVGAHTSLPVIGVPLSGGAAGGLDAILSTGQMPPGVPVTATALDGSANGALQAIRILALNDPRLERMYRGYVDRGSQWKAPMPDHSGKVRDTFAVENHDELLMQFASDRVSAFDWVLETPIPGKGKVLTALTEFWLGLSEIRAVLPNHLIAKKQPFIENQKDWASMLADCLVVVKKLKMIPLECIVRGYLEGSAWRSYQQDGTVNGVKLPEGLERGEKLAEPIFTPSTKAPEGEHDENISLEQAVELLGDPDLVEKLSAFSLVLYRIAAAYAEERGILLLDTKFEFGIDPVTGEITLADEVFTPDSSRFVDADTHVTGRAPLSMDKEIVREWLREESGWDPKADTPPPPLPLHVVANTASQYEVIAKRLMAA